MDIQWPLTLFTVVAGAGAGLLAFAGISEFLQSSKRSRFLALISSLVLLIVGGCISLFHLQNPANFMAAAGNLGSFSPISLELIFLGICVIVAIVYLVVVNREGSASKVLGVIGIVFGLLFGYFSGHGYEVIAVRQSWATPAVTFSYCLSAMTMGGFLFLALQATTKDEATAMKKTALVVGVVAVLETITYLIYGATGQIGDNAPLFWIMAVVVGGVAAAVAGIVAWLKVKTTTGMAYLGIVVAVAGAISFRAVMWLAGSTFVPNLFDIAANSRGLFPFN
ncbi:MAG: dimethyl sulfoxide reductase anchor subunit [Eggerthellaceae bacterium]|nr:dimethyl sulfoxide reductase anchor subunit [Eggerthellaceae bacterium]